MIKKLPAKAIFYIIIIIGVFFRLLYFGNIPVGFHGDEASIGFESFSLLKTGNDRWGIQMPAYLLSWGSGQNTLYAYLSTPFIYIFGLNEFSIRFLSGLTGLLCIPIVYRLCMVLFGQKNLAQLAAILYLFDPFLFMTSRWAEEINIIPFLVLLCLLVFSEAFVIIGKNTQLTFLHKILIISTIPCLILLFYGYAPSLFILPFFTICLLLVFWPIFKKQKTLFLASFIIGGVIFLPFFLFILKNNILQAKLPFEQYLPFSIPQLLSQREQIFIGFSKNLAIIKQNLFYAFSGFIDTYVWAYNSTNFRITHLFVFFIIPGLAFLLLVLIKNRNDPRNIILFWALASFIPFFLYHVNSNRSIHFQAIVPLIVAIGVFFMFEKLQNILAKRVMIIAFFVIFFFQTSVFFGEYFLKYPQYDTFPKGLANVVKAANKKKQANEKIAMSKMLVFNYLYAAIFSKYDPALFQKEVRTDQSTNNVIVYSFGDYYMLGDNINVAKPDNHIVISQLKEEKSFLAILRADENLIEFNSFDKIEYKRPDFHDWKLVKFNRKKD